MIETIRLHRTVDGWSVETVAPAAEVQRLRELFDIPADVPVVLPTPYFASAPRADVERGIRARRPDVRIEFLPD